MPHAGRGMGSRGRAARGSLDHGEERGDTDKQFTYEWSKANK